MDPAIRKCCAGPDNIAKAQCIERALEGSIAGNSEQSSQPGRDTTSALLTQTPYTSAFPSALTSDDNLSACQQFRSVVERCESSTRGFADLRGFSTKASCLCYSSASYQGSIYDGYYGSCLDFLATADTAGLSSIAASANGTITSSPCSAAAKTGGTSNSVASSSSFNATPSSQGGGGGFLNGPASQSQTAAPRIVSPTQSGSNPSTPSSQTGGGGGVKVSNPLGSRWCSFADNKYRVSR